MPETTACNMFKVSHSFWSRALGDLCMVIPFLFHIFGQGRSVLREHDLKQAPRHINVLTFSDEGFEFG